MAPRTLHQAMAYLGLAEQEEPVRDTRRAHDDYGDSHSVVYDFDDEDQYDGYPEEDYFSQDEENSSFEPVASVREDLKQAPEAEERQSRGRVAAERDVLAPERAHSMSQGPVSTGPVHIVSSQEHRAAPQTRSSVNRATTDESEEELRRITTIHPRSYNDAKIIGESFRESIPVIMNVTDMGESEAKRLVDFSAGLAFALHGSIERVTDKVFLLTPANLEVLGAEGAEVPVALDSESSDLFDQK